MIVPTVSVSTSGVPKGYNLPIVANSIIFGILKATLLYEYTSPVDAQGEPLENDPYVQEHIDLVAAIRTGNQIVEAEETAKSVLTAIMGRQAAYTGKKVTWEEMMGSDLKTRTQR